MVARTRTYTASEAILIWADTGSISKTRSSVQLLDCWKDRPVLYVCNSGIKIKCELELAQESTLCFSPTFPQMGKDEVSISCICRAPRAWAWCKQWPQEGRHEADIQERLLAWAVCPIRDSSTEKKELVVTLCISFCKTFPHKKLFQWKVKRMVKCVCMYVCSSNYLCTNAKLF